MPSYLHETLVEMFRHHPALAAEVLGDAFGLKLPGWQAARLDSAELPELSPTDRRADSVIVLADEANHPVLGVVVEVQLRRDPSKRRSWPVYLATLYARLRCPVVLLVVCPHRPTANWCADPIEVGHPDWVLHPLVLGPDQTPIITDVRRAAANPELAVLSTIAHGAGPAQDRVFEALFAALSAVTDEHAVLYHDLVSTALPAAARDHLEALMSTATGYREYRSDFVRRYVNLGRAEGEAAGRAEGEAAALMAVLAARGVEVPEPAAARIRTCTDLAQLETWIRRAATARRIDDLFDA